MFPIQLLFSQCLLPYSFVLCLFATAIYIYIYSYRMMEIGELNSIYKLLRCDIEQFHYTLFTLYHIPENSEKQKNL